ncbi:hypothetical protein CERSUDRAFT_112700, partial [Gelatoporia subvermispora B]
MPDNLRKPKPVYQNRNGFTDPLQQAVQGQKNIPNLHPIASDPDVLSRPRPEKRALWDAIEECNFVEQVMDIKGFYWPGIEAAKKASQQTETSASIAEEIAALRDKHTEETKVFCAAHGQAYHEEAFQRYLAKDDEVWMPHIETHYLMSAHSRYPPAASTLDDQMAALQYAHMKTLAPLLQKRATLVADEEKARRWLEAQFPDSISKWHALTNKDAKLRVSRFLLAAKWEQEQMLSKFNWSWRQTEPLQKEFEQNVRILTWLLIMPEVLMSWYNKNSFRTAVQKLIREVEAHDPRRRPSGQM